MKLPYSSAAPRRAALTAVLLAAAQVAVLGPALVPTARIVLVLGLGGVVLALATRRLGLIGGALACWFLAAVIEARGGASELRLGLCGALALAVVEATRVAIHLQWRPGPMRVGASALTRIAVDTAAAVILGAGGAFVALLLVGGSRPPGGLVPLGIGALVGLVVFVGRVARPPAPRHPAPPRPAPPIGRR